jgi:hypothetical protein
MLVDTYLYVNKRGRMSGGSSTVGDVPFAPKPRQTGVDAAINRAVRVHRQLLRLDERRQAVLADQAAAVDAALRLGATLRELADRLQISHEAVRKINGGAKRRR